VSKIILEGHIDVPYNDLDEVNLELPIHIELTRKEAGCLVFKVERDQVNK
jgi:autoinducer 2-degrading protein